MKQEYILIVIAILLFCLTKYLFESYLTKYLFKSYSTNETFTTKIIYENKPYISILQGFMSPSECKHVINLCEPRFTRSNVVNSKGTNEIDPVRTSSSCVIRESEDEIIKQIEQRAAQAAGVSVENIEGFQVVKYLPGQQYKAHNDWFHHEHGMKNQRYITIFCYLNDNFTGGETKFTNIGIDISPKQGDAAMWYNCETNDICYQEAMHWGSPPNSGIKYGLNIWIRFNKYR